MTESDDISKVSISSLELVTFKSMQFTNHLMERRRFEEEGEDSESNNEVMWMRSAKKRKKEMRASLEDIGKVIRNLFPTKRVIPNSEDKEEDVEMEIETRGSSRSLVIGLSESRYVTKEITKEEVDSIIKDILGKYKNSEDIGEEKKDEDEHIKKDFSLLLESLVIQ
ncbi:hypothetical protein EV426DRAFT_700395, partial [Tirmania nivea]